MTEFEKKTKYVSETNASENDGVEKCQRSRSYVVSDTCVEDNIRNNWCIKHDAAGRDRTMADIYVKIENYKMWIFR